VHHAPAISLARPTRLPSPMYFLSRRPGLSLLRRSLPESEKGEQCPDPGSRFAAFHHPQGGARARTATIETGIRRVSSCLCKKFVWELITKA
jgi:hypothetical protein